MMPMLPFRNPYLMHPGMAGIRPVMAPMLPIPNVPVAYPPNNINMGMSAATTSEYDSHIYGRFRHVNRDYPYYRHIPFDWYQPPKQQYNVIHEDAAVVTFDGPIPLDEFYRYYIYGESIDDSDYYDDSTSSESEEYDEPLYSNRPSNYFGNRSFPIDDDFDDTA